MGLNANRSVTWSPTIALSWLWGLGFFYAIHVTLAYGWLGFLSFAVTNAAGLFLFGWFLGSPNRDPAQILKNAGGAYVVLFLLCQLFAVAITIFGLVAYLWLPIIGSNPLIGVGVVVLGACAVGQSASLRVIRGLHAVYLVVGVIAAFVALRGLLATSGAAAEPVPIAAFDSRFYGLVLPTVVGFLLGPWTDIQQWQRAIEIRRDGGSVRWAYGVGALIFFGLLAINACLAAAAGRIGSVVTADGLPGFQATVAIAIERSGLHGAIIAYVCWAVIAAVSSIASAYYATRWFMVSLAANSVSPLLAFIPASFVSSPLWIIVIAIALAGAAIAGNLSQMNLMAPFATLLAGAAGCLAAESFGARRRYDAVLCYLIGTAAFLVFFAGYVVPVAALIAISPLIALLGVLPTIGIFFGFGKKPDAALTPTTSEPEPIAPTVIVANRDAAASYGFDGQTFVVHLVPTYDDTNSVGNIYFANYVRWVGKAREMFFDACMPEFDLKKTDYYVLTRSFTHQFRREAREFDPITVRIRISGHNRKFVTLEHEIHGEELGLLGRGEQSLMFVDTEHFRPLDIPRAIIEGFLPYWPKGSPHAAADDLQDALATHQMRSIES
jgi:YbgC/YbaW family acyl-CoA thioester hydrolase